MGRLSLQYRIVGGVLLGLAILFSFLGFLAVRTISKAKDVALEERLQLSETVAQSVDALLVHTAQQLERTARYVEANSDRPEKEQVEEIHDLLGEFEWIVRLSPQGEVMWQVPAASEGSGWPFAGDEAVLSALRQPGTSIVQSNIRMQEHPHLAIVITPIDDEQSQPAGFLAGELQPAYAEVSLISLPKSENSTRAEVVDAEGYIVAHSGEGEPYEVDEHVDILGPLIADNRAGTAIHHVEGGPDHVVAFQPFGSLPGGVVIEQTEDEALAIPQDMQRTMLIYGLGALIVASGAAWFHAHTVVRPIRHLADDAARMASGDLERPITATREDEIGVLSRRFDEMRVKLRASLEESARWAEELEDRVRQRTREVEERNRELDSLNQVRRQLLAKTISAQEEERKRLARELHDDSAQTLTAVLMTLKTAEDALASSPAQAQKALAKGSSQVDMALREIRKAILDLRPSALDDLGLASAARWFADEHLRPLGVKVSLGISGDEGLASGPVATAVFRIVQEAVSNIAKHSQAKNAKISLDFRESEVLVLVDDDGRGFDLRSLEQPRDDGRGLGLLGMRERAELFGGTVEIESSPQKGTRIRVRVPFE
ncbi:MAG: HAMP domain-containing protein [Chloroflexi bacterium]|nr:HAMP domain-containing protein [Chloroflexota bacterium]